MTPQKEKLKIPPQRKTLEQLLIVKAHYSTKNLHTKQNKKHKHEF